ncbi:MAG: PhzF family phenazine biosynthesis protein [Trueperaceae bacterium]
MNLPYEIWDVFTNKPLQGNPLALLPDASGLTEPHMQAIAKEFNLSETSFILPSGKADIRARYFTPTTELPMAGHPTIGTTFALHRHKKIKGESFKLELPAGVFEIGLEESKQGLAKVWMNQGFPKKLAEISDREGVAKALHLEVNDLMNLPVIIGSAGTSFYFVPVRTLTALQRASLMLSLLPKPNIKARSSVFVFTKDAPESDVRSRMFGEAFGIREDPATGGAHGPLGWYMATHGLLEFQTNTASFVSHQGVEMGRASELHVRVTKIGNDFEVAVGGQAVLVAEGTLHL